MNSWKIKILGSGTSTGIPIIGCKCAVCTSTDPRDQRLRTSILIDGDKKILIDTTPDLKTQLLTHQVDDLDFVVLTHEHADHLHGIDDLRPLGFHRGEGIPFYAHERLEETLHTRFPYIFNPTNDPIGGGIPNIALKTLSLFNSPITLGHKKFTFFELPHGRTVTLGFIYEDQGKKLGYIIDCHKIPPQTLEALRDSKLDILIMDCVTLAPHKTHLSRDLAFEYIEKIAPKRAGLIHMGHHLSHSDLETECRERFDFEVAPLYDNQIIEFI